MHQPKNVKTSLSRTGVSIRVFSLSLLLLGSMLTFISAMASSSQVLAQGLPKQSTHRLTSVRPHAITSVKKTLAPQKPVAPKVAKVTNVVKTVKLTKTQKVSQLSHQKLARNLDIPILGLLLGATKTQTTPAPPASAVAGTTTTETISVGGLLPDAIVALINSPLNIGSFLTLSVVDTTQGVSNVRLNPTAATNANWSITSSTPVNAAGLATTTFTYKGTGLPNAAGAFTLEDLVVDGDISGCPPIGVLDTAQVFLTFTNPLGTTGITPVNLLPSGIPVGLTNPAILVVPVTCAAATTTPTAVPSTTAVPTVSVTAVPSTTAVPTASVTAVPSTTAVVPGGTPALAIVKVNLNGDHFKVGDKVTYVIVVENLSSGDPVVAPNTISVSDVLPLGLDDIKVDVDNSQWSYTSSDKNGPALLTVNYAGDYPVAPGQTLAPITITGKLTNDAVPYITNTATVDTSGNSTVDNSATDTVFVDPNDNSHCCKPDGCCTDQNSNGGKDHNGHGDNNNGNSDNGNSNDPNDKNHGDHHHGKGSKDPVSGDPTSYNGTGDPTSYSGGGLPHLPLTGGAPLAG